MIPKKIHYCWLSGETIPEKLQRCIDTWHEVMPDYEYVLWDRERFDTNSVLFVKEACKEKKWAFAADYIRLHALYYEGGIYLDSDVIIKKDFEVLLSNGFITSVEHHPKIIDKHNSLALLNEDGSPKNVFEPKVGFGLQAAILGSESGHPYLKDCLEYYKDKHFIEPDGKFFDKLIAPDIFGMLAVKYGFRYVNERQSLKNNMLIFPSHVFAGDPENVTNETFAVHLSHGSWRNKLGNFKMLSKIAQNKFARKLFGKSTIV